MEFIREHFALLAGAFILWFGYGHLTEEPAAAAEKKKLQPIGPRYLAIRPDDQAAARLVDPYRFTELEPEAGPEDAEDASTATGSSDDEGGMDSRSPHAPRTDGAGTTPRQGSSPNGRTSAGSGREPNPNTSPRSGGSGRGPNPNTSPRSGGSGRGPNPNTSPRSGGSGRGPNPNTSPRRGGSGRGPNPNTSPRSGGSGRGPNPNTSPSPRRGGSGRGPNPNGGVRSVGGARSTTWPQGVGDPVFITDTGLATLPAMEESVRLWVEAVVALPDGGGSARISGVRVEVGEGIPSLDEATPPVLVSTSGMSATVRYRTVDYTLTLDAPPIVIEPRPPEPSEMDNDGWLDDLFPEDGE